jgi:hypothetical protein
MRFTLIAGCVAAGLLASSGGHTADNTLSKSQKWEFAWDAPWVNKYLVRDGYVPIVQGANRYYCSPVASEGPGSRLNSRIFCADADVIRKSFDRK